MAFGISVQVQITRPKKRHNLPTAQFNSSATVKPDPYRYASIIQTYPINQILRKKNLKTKQIHKRIVLKSRIKYDTWRAFFPATINVYATVLQIFPYRTLTAKLKHKLLARRHLISKYGTSKYLDTPVLPPIPVIIFNPVLQPYGYKQFITKWKAKKLQKRHLNMRYGSPKYVTWKTIIPVVTMMPTIAVNIINTLLKTVKLSK